MVSKKDEDGIVALKWKDTRDLRLLFTKHAPILVSVTRPQKVKTRVDDIDVQEPPAK